MPKTKDGVEIDGHSGTIWAVNGLKWPHSLLEFPAEDFDADGIGTFYSCKAAAIDEAQRRLDERKAESELRHAREMEEVAERQKWIDTMRADLMKLAALTTE